jgi:hypothetical protein
MPSCVDCLVSALQHGCGVTPTKSGRCPTKTQGLLALPHCSEYPYLEIDTDYYSFQVCVYVSVYTMYICAYICIHVYRICLHACVHVYTCLSTQMHKCLRVSVSLSLCVCVSVFVCVCVHGGPSGRRCGGAGEGGTQTHTHMHMPVACLKQPGTCLGVSASLMFAPFQVESSAIEWTGTCQAGNCKVCREEETRCGQQQVCVNGEWTYKTAMEFSMAHRGEKSLLAATVLIGCCFLALLGVIATVFYMLQ